MTSINTARGAIYAAFVSGWGATSAFQFDNEATTRPEKLPFARLVVRHDLRQQESLGGLTRRKFESGGSVIIQCFGPLDEGAAGADTLAEAARGIFEGKTITPEGIRFTSATVREIGPTPDAYQINVEATFTYTETK